MKKRVFVADDDPAIRDVFKIIFENAGYDIEIKANANDLLELNSNYPDLFIIDRLLSGLDGLDICKYLKNQAVTKRIPLIIVSASPDVRRLAKNAGADEFIEKPFGVSTLLNKVEELLKESQGVSGEIAAKTSSRRFHE